MNKLTKYLTIPVLATFLFINGCKKKEQPKELTINGSTYTISGNKILQTNSSFLEDNQIKIGAVSDIEAALPHANYTARKLKKQNLDAIIIAGDCYENEFLRKPHNPGLSNNVDEMVAGIKNYAELGIPIFIIPGNHETKASYNIAIKKLKEDYPNVFDINKKTVDLQGLNIVGLGGYHDARFTTQGGFLLNSSDYKTAEKSLEQLQSQNELDILVTHGPPKSKTKIDYVYGVGHVGDTRIADIMNSPVLQKILNLHGHIHEGGNHSDNYKSGKSRNIASITDYGRSSDEPNSEVIIIK